jgi:8-oxo-dGTP pyrophosphatase MutT (NUDIX family)
MVVALTDEGQAVLVRQYKHGCGQVVCECPAGYIHAGEDAAAAAARELREETGYEAAALEPLASLFASPATMPHRMHLFLARGLRVAGRQALDPAEDIEVLLVNWDELMARVRRNEMVVDAASVAALHLAAARLGEAE